MENLDNIHSAIDELFNYVDINAIKSFTHQIMRGNNLNQEFKLTKRGFDFYAGYKGNVIQCQFDKSKEWTYDINNSSITDAVEFLKNKIREYMVLNSLWEYKLD